MLTLEHFSVKLYKLSAATFSFFEKTIIILLRPVVSLNKSRSEDFFNLDEERLESRLHVGMEAWALNKQTVMGVLIARLMTEILFVE